MGRIAHHVLVMTTLENHTYIKGKMGFKGVSIIFLLLVQNKNVVSPSRSLDKEDLTRTHDQCLGQKLH